MTGVFAGSVRSTGGSAEKRWDGRARRLCWRVCAAMIRPHRIPDGRKRRAAAGQNHGLNPATR
ncbi:hypothetical protein [Azospirillum argentinense]